MTSENYFDEESKEEIGLNAGRSLHEINTSRINWNSMEDPNFGAILEEIKENEEERFPLNNSSSLDNWLFIRR